MEKRDIIIKELTSFDISLVFLKEVIDEMTYLMLTQHRCLLSWGSFELIYNKFTLFLPNKRE